MTRQTTAPLRRLAISTSHRQARWLVKQIDDGDLDINPPYQRGAVWTEDQRVALMYSLLTGTIVPSLIINNRHHNRWTDRAAYNPDNPTSPSYAVVDGKQRLLCVRAWFRSELAIPASWLPAEEVLRTVDTADGPYVYADGLTELGRRMTGERILLAVGEAEVNSVRDEAALYLLVNGGGTPQTDADMSRAAKTAEKE